MEFTRKDTATVMDGMVVRYKCDYFEINASRKGVSTDGCMPLIRDLYDLDTVREYLHRAFLQYGALSSRNDPLPESEFDGTVQKMKEA